MVGRVFAFICGAILLGSLTAATAENSLTVSSDTGEPVGGGRSYSYQSPGAYFSLKTNGPPGSAVCSVNWPGPFRGTSYYWTFNFNMEGGIPLRQGTFPVDGARDWRAFGATLRTVSGLDQPTVSTTDATGIFEVKNVIYRATTATSSGYELHALWITFTIHDRGGGPALRGELKVNADSTAAPTDLPPVAWAGVDRRAPILTPAALRGAAGDDASEPSGILTSRWEELSGPGLVEFANPADPQTTASFQTPGIYSLRLTASDGHASAADAVEVVAYDPAAHHLAQFAEIFSSESTAQAEVWQTENSEMTASMLPDGSLQISVRKYPGGTWTSFEWVPPVGTALAVGSYEARTNASPTTTEGALRSSRLSGRATFEIREFQMDSAQNVTSFWALFSSGDRKYERIGFGEIRFHAGPALGNSVPPLVAAGTDREATRWGYTDLLGCAAGKSGNPGVPRWSVISGPGTATIADPAAFKTTVTFSAPGRYVLRLTTTNGALEASDEVVVEKTLHETFVALRAPGLPDTPESLTAFFTPDATRISLEQPTSAAAPDFLEMRVRKADAPSVYLSLYGSGNQRFAPGTFHADDNEGSPRLLIQAEAWWATKGDFEIKELTRSPSGEVTTLWVVMHGNGPKGPILAEVRYRAEAANDPPNAAPTIGTVPVAALPTGLLVPIDLGVSDDLKPYGQTPSVTWEQLSGPATAVIHGSGVRPSVMLPKAGPYRMRLTVSDGELSSSRECSFVGGGSRTYRGTMRSGEIPGGLFTVTLLPTGRFTARLNFANGQFPVSGKLEGGSFSHLWDFSGTAVSFTLTLDPLGTAIRGTFSIDGVSLDLFASQTTATHLTGSKTASSHAGRHTFLIEPAGEPAPQGFGFGRLQIQTDGRFALVGVLADGAAWSNAGWLTADDAPVLFGAMAGGRETIVGHLRFGTGTEDSPTLQAELVWSLEPAPRRARFAGGFDTLVALAGSRFQPPAANQNLLNLATKALPIQIGAGPIAAETPLVHREFELPAQKVTVVFSQPSDRFALRLYPSTGLFSGTFREPTGKVRTFRGAVLQESEFGAGFYLDGNGAGAVALEPR